MQPLHFIALRRLAFGQNVFGWLKSCTYKHTVILLPQEGVEKFSCNLSQKSVV